MDIAGITDIGKLRARNEDSIGVDAALGLMVVADGMGGHNAGDVASRLAIEHILAAARETVAVTADDTVAGRLHAAVKRANDAILDAARQDFERSGMGTTVVAAWLGATHVDVAHVGDSRLYRARDGQLQMLTRDHSQVQELVDRGILTPAQARVSTRRNFLSRALGTDPDVQIDLARHELRPGDAFLLCSDGLTNMLEDEEIAAALHAAHDSRAIAERLVSLANERGGRDNISVVIARPV
jgi:serine/threonine protein phosphatase PrpC